MKFNVHVLSGYCLEERKPDCDSVRCSQLCRTIPNGVQCHCDTNYVLGNNYYSCYPGMFIYC